VKTSLFIANVCRVIGRIIATFVFILGIFYLLFTGLQLASGETGNLAIYLYFLLLVGLLIGFAITWWKECLGATVVFISLVGSFILSGRILPGAGARQGFSLFVGPLNLLFALLIPGYHLDHSPSSKWVPLISWILPIVPVLLFYVSWSIRRRIPESAYADKNLAEEADERIKKELLELLVEGMDNLEIAERLHIHPVHASLLTASLLKEYGAENRAELGKQVKNNVGREINRE